MIELSKNVPIFNAENIGLSLDGLLITDEILKKEIPFIFRKCVFSCNNLYYRANQYYHMQAGNISSRENNLLIKKLSFVPEYSRTQFVKRLKCEKDLYKVAVSSIELTKVFWGFKDGKVYFNADTAFLDKVSANIFRSKIPPDNMDKKLLYNSQLRSIPFPLKLDNLIVRNSRIVYEEEINPKSGSGSLIFSKFNLNAKHIESGFGERIIPDVIINVNCKFMEASPMRINWTFNVLDKSDGFKIKGSIKNFDTNKLSPFFRPYMNMEAQGFFDEVNFNLAGNDRVSHGECGLKYHDFKIAIYKKRKPGMKSKLKTAIANLLIKNNSNGNSKIVTVEVKRIQEKSFYNFLWRSVGEGIKQILLPL